MPVSGALIDGRPASVRPVAAPRAPGGCAAAADPRTRMPRRRDPFAAIWATPAGPRPACAGRASCRPTRPRARSGRSGRAGSRAGRSGRAAGCPRGRSSGRSRVRRTAGASGPGASGVPGASSGVPAASPSTGFLLIRRAREDEGRVLAAEPERVADGLPGPRATSPRSGSGPDPPRPDRARPG